MIIQLNKHGPRSDLMQGEIHRGLPLLTPIRPNVMVIKPPGSRGRSYCIASSGSTIQLKYPTPKTGPPNDIAFGQTDESQSVMPLIYNPPTTLNYTVNTCIAGGMPGS